MPYPSGPSRTNMGAAGASLAAMISQSSSGWESTRQAGKESSVPRVTARTESSLERT